MLLLEHADQIQACPGLMSARDETGAWALSDKTEMMAVQDCALWAIMQSLAIQELAEGWQVDVSSKEATSCFVEACATNLPKEHQLIYEPELDILNMTCEDLLGDSETTLLGTRVASLPAWGLGAEQNFECETSFICKSARTRQNAACCQPAGSLKQTMAWENASAARPRRPRLCWRWV